MERQRSAVDFSAHRPCQFRDFQVFGFAFRDDGLCFAFHFLCKEDGVKRTI